MSSKIRFLTADSCSLKSFRCEKLQVEKLQVSGTAAPRWRRFPLTFSYLIWPNRPTGIAVPERIADIQDRGGGGVMRAPTATDLLGDPVVRPAPGEGLGASPSGDSHQRPEGRG